MPAGSDRIRFWTPATYFPLLRARLKSHKISQRALARHLGHTQATQVCRWLNGRVGATWETMAKMEDAFQALLHARNGTQEARSPGPPTSVPSEPHGAADGGGEPVSMADQSGQPSPA